MFKNIRKALRNIFRDALAIYLGLRDPTVPRLAKIVGLAAVAYFLLPFDFVPDVVPIIGWLDDLALLPLATILAGKLVPLDVMTRLRSEADLKLMRWGPRIFHSVLAFIVLWIALMGVGGWYIWRDMRRANIENEAPFPAWPYENLTPASETAR